GDGEVSVGAGGDEHAALDVAVAVRLFVAVELGERARAAIAEEQGRLRAIAGKGSRVRWVGPEQLHLTLVFLGEGGPARAAGVVQAMGRPIERAPIELTFAGIGAFPPRGAPRALWIGLRGGESDLKALQHEVASRVAALGIPLEERPFSPHLTL